jgi:hypothetical protein
MRKRVQVIKKEDEVLLSEELYKDYKTTEWIDWQQNAVDNEAFLQNIQFPIEVVEAHQEDEKPLLVDNETLVVVTQMANLMTDNEPRFKVLGREESDIKSAQYYSDLYEYIHNISNGNRQVRRLVKDLLTTGKCVTFEYVDVSDVDPEIKFKAIDPKHDLISPDSKEEDGSDSPHDLIVYDVTEDFIKLYYPEINTDELESSPEEVVPSPTYEGTTNQPRTPIVSVELKYLAIERFTKVRKVEYRIYDPYSDFDVIVPKAELPDFLKKQAVIVQKEGKFTYGLKDKDVEDLKAFYEENDLDQSNGFYHLVQTQDGQILPMGGTAEGHDDRNTIPDPRSTTKITFTNIGKLIKEDILIQESIKSHKIRRVFSIGGKLIVDEILDRKTSPIKRIMLHHNRNPYPLGDVTLLRPLQEQLNATETIILTYAQNLANVKVFVPEGNSKLINELRERGNKPGFEAFEYDSTNNGVPIFPQMQQMPTEFYRQKEDIKNQMRRIVGVNALLEGDTSATPRTKGATYLYTELSSQRSRSKQKLIEDLLNRVAFGVNEYIPKVYNYRKVVRVIKPNHKDIFTVINERKERDGRIVEIINDTTIAKYDIIYVSGSMLPTNRQARAEYYVSLMQMGVPGLLKHILRNSEIEDVEEVIAEIDEVNNLQNALGQAQEEIKRLQGDLQTREREVYHAKQAEELSKFKGNLKAINEEVKTEARVTKNNIKQQKETTND